MRPDPAPDVFFADRPFLVRDAVRLGYGPDVFDHRRWHQLFRGVRSKVPLSDNLRDRALQYVPRLRPGERFSHATALAVLECPIRVPANAPVDVSSPSSLGAVECQGVSGHRHQAASDAYPAVHPDHDGWIPVTPPLEAVLQSASQLPFPEIVVALDHLLLRDPERYDPMLHVTPDELSSFAATASGRGVVRFRAAAALARVGAESRMETLMRLANVRVGGPELHLQLELYDADGQWIGRFDGVDEETLCIFEYDGEHHFSSRKQRRRDPRKHQAARDAGWRIKVFYVEDLLESLLVAGRSMLTFSGREERPVEPRLAELLDEHSDENTESAIPLRKNAFEP